MKLQELRKLIKEELSNMNENISQYEMMDGLVKITSSESFESAIIDMFDDLYTEGFSLDDIEHFLQVKIQLIKNQMPNYPDDSLEEVSDEEVENQKEYNAELEKTAKLKDEAGLNEQENEEPTDSDLNKSDSVTKLAGELEKITKEMKSKAKKFKESTDESEKKEIKDRLKELTKVKKEIEALL